MKKPKVLILCTGNSCRSQMAEAILRNAVGDLLEVHSAGSKPAGYVHPKAIEVLREIDLEIDDPRSKSLDEFLNQDIQTVITVCDSAHQECPVFPGQVSRYHWSFEDPAGAEGSEEEVMDAFRNIRNQIKFVFEAYAAGWRDGRGLF